jgi:hypothetical protein
LLDEFDITLKDSGIELIIVSGLDAMGRVSDNEKILQLFQDLTVLNNIPEVLLPIFKFVETVKYLANGRDVSVDDIIKSEEQMQQEQQAQQQAMQEQQATDSLMKKAEPDQIAEAMESR